LRWNRVIKACLGIDDDDDDDDDDEVLVGRLKGKDTGV
jgi:hypothetical protein